MSRPVALRWFLVYLFVLPVVSCAMKPNPLAQKSLAEVLEASHSQDVNARQAAAQELGRRGPEGLDRQIEMLLDKSEDLMVRRAVAIRLLSEGGGQTKSKKVSALLETLNEENIELRWTAAFVLYGVEPQQCVAVVATMTELLREDDPRWRQLGAEFLEELGPEAASALPDLKKLWGAEGETPEVKKIAAKAVQQIESCLIPSPGNERKCQCPPS